MSIKLVCTNCKKKYKFSRWHTRIPTRCQVCGGMLTGDLTAYYKHVVAHPTRYAGEAGGSGHGVRALAKVAGVAFLFGVVITAVLFTWYRSTQVPRLMAQLGSDQEEVWTEAMEDLVKMGRRAVPALVRNAAGGDDTLSKRALLTLERLGEKALEPLVELLAGGDAELSRSAAAVLPRVSGPEALPRLKALYASRSDPEVRSVLLGVFERHPRAELLVPLIGSLRLPAEDAEDQAFNRRVDEVCRRIVEAVASELPDSPLGEPPTDPAEWPQWLKEHRAALAEVVKAQRTTSGAAEQGEAE